MPVDGAFTALLLFLFSAVCAVIVPAPSDVNVSCDGARVTLSWRSSGRQAHSSFRLNVSASTGDRYEAETTEPHYDLSDLALRHYLDFLYVSVTARQGDATSRPVDSLSFTFNHDKMAQIKCALEFPPVELRTEESGTSVRFENPALFYKQLKQGSNVSIFKFQVSNISTSLTSSDQGEFHSVCRSTDVFCRYDLPDQGDTCVTLRGFLYEGNERVKFRQTEPVCPTKSTAAHVLTFTILMMLLLLVVAAVTASICAAKAWTLNQWTERRRPDALEVNPAEPKHHTVGDEVFCQLTVVDANRCRSPSLSDEEAEDTPSPTTQSTKCYYGEGGLSGDSEEEEEAVKLISGGEREEEEPRSSYDRPQRCV